MEMLPKIFWLYQWDLETNSALLLVSSISISINIILVITSLLSLSCRVFTIIYLKQTIFLGYTRV